ncbi:hypothetical protein Q8791_23445 [Nocardiopsis sp. CT-R113]|uniref:Phage protein n=1 Tax=Nocardiopsis codii TaxID=3065942 RepID=A0ABU7KD70_9ACTN|nr:hypothetical protein [Nocardiopsis sp. CT-R113]MEE2040176.1 hypothetical protein [Nocardiopsis sp. CT-R113]
MAQNRKTRRTLSAVKRKFADKLGLESAENPVVPFEGEDGRTYTIPHPLFAGDEWSDQVDAAKTTADKARAILGDQYEQFRDHPEHSDNDVFLIFMDIQTSLKDELVDGAGPTQS